MLVYEMHLHVSKSTHFGSLMRMCMQKVRRERRRKPASCCRKKPTKQRMSKLKEEEDGSPRALTTKGSAPQQERWQMKTPTDSPAIVASHALLGAWSQHRSFEGMKLTLSPGAATPSQ